MIIRIEPESEIPIYIQLTNQIIEGIAKGELKPGESLPSVRTFAADLGVNMHTVNKSYHELEKRGSSKLFPSQVPSSKVIPVWIKTLMTGFMRA